MSDPRRQRCASSISYSADCSPAITAEAQIFANVSTMKDECGDAATPFKRWVQYFDVCGTTPITDCLTCVDGALSPEGGTHCVSGISDDLARENQPADVAPNPDPTTNPNTAIVTGNTFTYTGAKADLTCLPRVGFKNVQGFKAWHGAFPFDHTVAGVNCAEPIRFWTGTGFETITQADIDAEAYGDWSDAITYGLGDVVRTGTTPNFTYWRAIAGSTNQEPAIGSAYWAIGTPNLAGTKYLAFNIKVRWKTGQYDPGHLPYTYDPSPPYAPIFAIEDAIANATITADYEFEADVSVDRTTGQIEMVLITKTSHVGDLSAVPGGWNNLFTSLSGGFDGIAQYLNLDECAQKKVAIWDYPDTDGSEIIRSSFSFTADTLSRHWVGWSVPYDYSEATIEIALSDPYHLQHHASEPSVMDDYTALTAEWRMADNATNTADGKKMLWRQDENVFLAPLVTRSERAATSPCSWDKIEFDDYANPLLDGDGDSIDDGVDWTPTWGTVDYYDTGFLKWNNAVPTTSTEAAAMELVTIGKYTGAIIGAPLPFGYGYSGGTHRGVWNVNHANYYRDVDCTPHALDSDLHHGAWTPGILQANTPQWTSDELFLDLVANPHALWPCAFIKATNAGIYAQKFVETVITRPSYDFARPYGADKFLLDEASAGTTSDTNHGINRCYCASDFDAEALTATITGYDSSGDPETPADIADIATGLWGGASVGGWYSGCSYSAGTVTLGTKVLDVPTGWTSKSGDTATVFGRLRWETSGHVVPGFGGKLAVTATDLSGDTLLSYAASPYIVTGDKVDLWTGAAWDDNSGAGYTLTRLSDTTGSIAGSHLTATQIVPHKLYDGTTSGQKHYFADAQPKGDYVYRSFNLWAGEPSVVFAHSAEQRCLAFKPCGRVVGCSPNVTEDATSDRTENWNCAGIQAFPTTITNGEVWLGVMETQMVDPLWQAPHRKCGLTRCDYWQQDDGTCQADAAHVPEIACGGGTVTDYFFPLPPYIEPRLTPPATFGPAHDETAPTPPSPVDLAAYVAPPGEANTPLESGAIGFSFGGDEGGINPTVQTPWGIYLNQQGCVCANGRFKDEYQANKAAC